MLGKVADAGRIRGIHRGIVKADDKTRQWRNKGKAGGKRASVLIGSRCHDDAGRHPERKPKGNKGQHINKKKKKEGTRQGFNQPCPGAILLLPTLQGHSLQGHSLQGVGLSGASFVILASISACFSPPHSPINCSWFVTRDVSSLLLSSPPPPPSLPP